MATTAAVVTAAAAKSTTIKGTVSAFVQFKIKKKRRKKVLEEILTLTSLFENITTTMRMNRKVKVMIMRTINGSKNVPMIYACVEV